MSELLLKFYPVARTAHVERILLNPSVYLYYTRTRLDFDTGVRNSAGDRLRQGGVWKFVVAIIRLRPRWVEVPEPLAVRCWPQILSILIFVRFVFPLLTLFRVERPVSVSYCIENCNQGPNLAETLRLPRRLGDLLVHLETTLAMNLLDRVAFGTQGALDTYKQSMFRYDKVRAECGVILALPHAQIDRSLAPQPRGPHLVFLGTFERRKGILELLAAWDQVRNEVQNAKLTVIGSGEHQSAVEEFVQKREECSLVVSPARAEIFALLKQAKALALLSQREVGWREQVGLPIVEALSVGCEIVTTEETGIADWLMANGHHVLSTDATTSEVAASLKVSLLSRRTPSDVLGSLPLRDGRMEAESWLLDASR